MFTRFLCGFVTLLFATSAFAQEEQRAVSENRFSLPWNSTRGATNLTDSRIRMDNYNGIGIRYETEKASGFVAKVSGGNHTAPNLLSFDKTTQETVFL